MEFLRNPMFWLAVIAVAIVTNIVWAKFGPGGSTGGKLV